MTSGIPQKLAATRLPLVPRLPDICAALDDRGVVIVRSDPGSGKSTLVPLALMHHDDERSGTARSEGRIIMLEGRRAAAMGIASRMAELLDEKVGERVGYAVRLERKISSRTRIEVLTEGLFIRRLQGDPDLKGVSAVIFDEFHERSVYTDLALAFMLDLRHIGAGFRLIIMSATMDAQKIAGCIGGAEGQNSIPVPVIDCPGQVFPVDIHYRPLPRKAPLGREVAAAVMALVSAEHTAGDVKVPKKNAGDVLVFLPGKREIEDARQELTGAITDSEILVLHGGLPLSRQREIIAPRSGENRRRIILSTNLAETALTIPGITMVVDSGFARLERYHIPTGMNRLSLEPVSRHSADQRAGRAGRLMPGRCVRLWSEGDLRPAETEAEIRRIDLSGLVLECLLWGVTERNGLPWLEPPPEAAWDRAVELLNDLGALDNAGRPTDRGREMTTLGLDPRLAQLCIAGREGRRPGLACAAAAILSERDGSGINGDGDFSRRLSMVRNSPNHPWAKGIVETAGELLRRLYLPVGIDAVFWTPEDEADMGELLAAAFPDRIAALQESGKFRFVSGREARIEGPLERSEWLVAPDVDAGERSAFIRLAAPITKEQALKVLNGQITREEHIEWKGLIPRSRIVRSAGRLVISAEQQVSRRDAVIQDLLKLFEQQGLALLPWEDEGQRLLERIRFFTARGDAHDSRRGLGGDMIEAASWTDEALIHESPRWLGPFIWEGQDIGRGPIIDGTGLKAALEARLGFTYKRDLDTLVPDAYTLPNGKQRKLAYDSGEPLLRVRLQDCFGISAQPCIMGAPVVFCLLSPADRPLQTTRDLPGFWKGSYAEVRKEMRGRYPKHHWPEI